MRVEDGIGDMGYGEIGWEMDLLWCPRENWAWNLEWVIGDGTTFGRWEYHGDAGECCAHQKEWV